ncbi:MAG: hypothetical protein ACOCUS_07335 [Polyangiales bacterium]
MSRCTSPGRARRHRVAAAAACGALALSLGACEGTPDPREVHGALKYAAQAVEKRDARKLYRVVDERARHAMHSIVHDRREAARLVRESYPEDERAQALRRLGEAAEVEDPPGLFAVRCDDACLDDLEARIGAPDETHEDGEELVVHTARGTEVRLYRSASGSWWGIVWNTDELAAERDKANQDLRAIRRNAEIYERRRELDKHAGP